MNKNKPIIITAQFLGACLWLFAKVPNVQAVDVVARWIGGDGNRSNPANWDIGRVPNNGGGTNYTAVIDLPAINVTVTINQSVTIGRLINSEVVLIAAGSNAVVQQKINSGTIQITAPDAGLTLSGDVTDTGQITATNGALRLASATLNANGSTAVVFVNGPTALTGVSLYAANGAVIS
jgi:hypothetical protein